MARIILVCCVSACLQALHFIALPLVDSLSISLLRSSSPTVTNYTYYTQKCDHILCRQGLWISLRQKPEVSGVGLCAIKRSSVTFDGCVCVSFLLSCWLLLFLLHSPGRSKVSHHSRSRTLETRKRKNTHWGRINYLCEPLRWRELCAR